MSFKKRNVAITPNSGVAGKPANASTEPSSLTPLPSLVSLAPGIRLSTVDGRLTTSTGTTSLDSTLAGHAGLPLGHSLLLQESTTTDFGGLALRYFAAEGLVQGHHVHVLGVSESWKASLPGLASKQDSRPKRSAPKIPDDRMKIAWRYETFEKRQASGTDQSRGSTPFCHRFDLNKRLEPGAVKGQLFTYPLSPTGGNSRLIAEIKQKLVSSPTKSIHRIIIPGFLLPTIYAPQFCRPTESLQFLHCLRALLRQFSDRTAAMLTIPADLYPASSGLGKWIELMHDAVAHLIPTESQPANNETSDATETIQGYMKMRRLPVYNEKGGGLEDNNLGETLSFHISSTSGLVIAPLVLPPAIDSAPVEPSSSKVDLEF
ncbi:Elongator complex protein 4 [Ceratocystis fimbriata CBS 114723]|uniref:Elongator complex protein 4 n=1 Tax=Ceratocystis fimbriata CBS 114723 TaxID=1035309 RepID=A0A2C5X3K1_9PEZI|nr:Elongator complex protein 4 [Ceratocystis fimbriata CBS 114723]